MASVPLYAGATRGRRNRLKALRRQVVSAAGAGDRVRRNDAEQEPPPPQTPIKQRRLTNGSSMSRAGSGQADTSPAVERQTNYTLPPRPSSNPPVCLPPEPYGVSLPDERRVQTRALDKTRTTPVKIESPPIFGPGEGGAGAMLLPGAAGLTRCVNDKHQAVQHDTHER